MSNNNFSISYFLRDHITFYLLPHAYPIALFGSLFYGIVTIVNMEPLSLIINKNILIFINLKIGLLGLISLFNWFQNAKIPYIGKFIVPWDNHMIKIVN
jgi:hypothetical protein